MYGDYGICPEKFPSPGGDDGGADWSVKGTFLPLFSENAAQLLCFSEALDALSEQADACKFAGGVALDY